MADPMCPAEVMARAEHEFKRHSTPGLGGVAWEKQSLAYRNLYIEKKRAGLRALAEMEPTEEMKIAIRSELHGVLTAGMIRDAWNGMCLAAAGDLGRIVLPSSTT